MGDSTLLPPSQDLFPPATPSGLTPNTRSEAEAALTLNSTAQTDSAAPTTPLGDTMRALEGEHEGNVSEAQKAYRRPAGPIRTSSTNYEKALRDAHQQSSVSSNLSTDTAASGSITGQTIASPTSSTVPLPAPGQGVVPLHTGVGTGQFDAVKKARPSGLSLGQLGRQQSWSEQDFKHVYSAGLMGEVKNNPGYDSGTEELAK